jgi:hypothetical protein
VRRSPDVELIIEADTDQVEVVQFHHHAGNVLEAGACELARLFTFVGRAGCNGRATLLALPFWLMAGGPRLMVRPVD